MFADRLVLLVCLLVVLLVWVWFRWVLGFGLLLVAFCFYVFGGVGCLDVPYVVVYGLSMILGFAL